MEDCGLACDAGASDSFSSVNCLSCLRLAFDFIAAAPPRGRMKDKMIFKISHRV